MFVNIADLSEFRIQDVFFWIFQDEQRKRLLDADDDDDTDIDGVPMEDNEDDVQVKTKQLCCYSF